MRMSETWRSKAFERKRKREREWNRDIETQKALSIHKNDTFVCDRQTVYWSLVLQCTETLRVYLCVQCQQIHIPLLIEMKNREFNEIQKEKTHKRK